MAALTAFAGFGAQMHTATAHNAIAVPAAQRSGHPRYPLIGHTLEKAHVEANLVPFDGLQIHATQRQKECETLVVTGCLLLRRLAACCTAVAHRRLLG